MSIATMADTTSHETEMSREEIASYLRSIASELEGDSSPVRIPIGNKEVSLSPSGPIAAETTVVERSRRLRKDSEELTLAFKWSPSGETNRSAASVEGGERG